jgi:hypothetical protein
MLVLQDVCSTNFSKLLNVCSTITMYFDSAVQCLYTMTNGGTGTVPQLFMIMQTGSTSNHISQIFFVLAALM